jgi:hypothetical protein
MVREMSLDGTGLSLGCVSLIVSYLYRGQVPLER